jgi:hypothetical protein
MTRPRPLVAVFAVALLTGCGGAGGVDSTGSQGPADAKLNGACPTTVVVQMPWTPQAENGALYRLVGEGYSIDAARKRVTGRLTAGGKPTGVAIELRAGGPPIGVQSTASRMYGDPDVLLGMVSTDDAIELSAKRPVLAVMAPLEKAPYMIQWDPKQHPDFHSIIDVGRSKAAVAYAPGAAYMEFLIGTGILRRDQVEASYDGSPTRWLASGGKIAQQGFATSDPYLYETALAQWKKPVDFQLIHDAGYPIYADAVVVRADKKAAYAACLRRLVPMIQRAEVEFLKDPGATIDLIVKANDAFGGPPYSAEQARFSVERQVALGIVGTGSNATLGDFDFDRVWKVLDIMTPIFAGQGKELKSGLTEKDLYTNEFIDKSVGLSLP